VSNPLDDTSRWVMLGSRFEPIVDGFIAAEMDRMMRTAYGDEIADAMRALVPPPLGTFGTTQGGQSGECL
jgi:hypothetical protein